MGADKKRVFVEEPEPTLRKRLAKIAKNPARIPPALIKGLDMAVVYTGVKLFGGLAYNRNYLKGKWFAKPWSPGWRWAWNGMLGKAIFGVGRGIPWPVSPQGSFTANVDFHVDDINNFQGPIHFQSFGNARIRLGRGVWIARGCALITSNHDPENPDVHLEPKDIIIGDHCWLGTNVVIMPGVVLGPYTTVGANAVVTKCFPEGHCILAGVPAKVIRVFEPEGKVDNTLHAQAVGRV